MKNVKKMVRELVSYCNKHGYTCVCSASPNVDEKSIFGVSSKDLGDMFAEVEDLIEDICNETGISLDAAYAILKLGSKIRQDKKQEENNGKET